MRFLRCFILLYSLFFVCHASSAKIIPLDRVVAIVNDGVITQKMMETQLKIAGQEILHSEGSLPDTATLSRQVLDKLILDEIQLQLAQRSGIHVTDEMLDNTIARIAKENNFSIAEFRDVLKQQDIDYGIYRNRIRNDQTIGQLHQRDLYNDISISDLEIDQFLDSPNGLGSMTTEYKVGHILISLPANPSPEEVKESEIKAAAIVNRIRDNGSFKNEAIQHSTGQLALQGGDLGWRKAAELPTLFSNQVVRLKQNEVLDPIRSASGFHIVTLFDKRQAELPEHKTSKTKVRHILVKSNALLSEEQAKQKLLDIKNRILDGEGFAELAKTYSEDLASQEKGGDIGWVTDEVLVPEFSAMMHQVPEGEISEPFSSPFGWHILQVLDKKVEDDSKAHWRQTAKKMIMQRKFEEKLLTWQRQMRDESFVKIITDEA